MKKYKYISSLIAATLLFGGCGGSNSTDDNTSVDGSTLSFLSSATQTITEGDQTAATAATNASDSVTFSIIGGADADQFEIDSSSGVLTFKVQPDFENPLDTDTDNIYVVSIQAEDSEQNVVTQTVTITVRNDTADDGPEFTSSSSVSINENRNLDFTVAANGAVSYTLSGQDQNRFALDQTSGVLRFLNFMPDFEHSSDTDHNNIYEISIIASDDQNLTSRQALTIEVLNDTTDDADEENRVTIYKTGADDGIISGDTFGEKRNFTQETIGGDRIIQVGNRVWQDSTDNVGANYSFNEAENYCNNLNYAGITSWRVPNRHELYEIVNYANAYSATPTIDDIFENAEKALYRTSENILGQNGSVISNLAFSVSFTDGASYPMKRDLKQAVRCMSGDPLIYDTEIARGEDDIYRDSKTGFMWAKAAGPETLADAKARCENLVFGGYNDWRVPNISELHTVMPSVIEGSNHPYGAKPLLEEGATQLWSATKITDTNARYLDNYWNTELWGNDGSLGGRDVANDASLDFTDPESVYSICIRGGHL